jgi:hypothetical protein
MRCSLNLLVPLTILASCAAGLAQSRTYNLGTTLSQEEVRGLGFMVGPAGKELPPGSGTAKEGAEIFAQRCALCHGPNGEGGIANRLVVGSPANLHHGPFKDNEKHATSYYPYATIAWDYINRAMPADKPGSLSAAEVYAVTAFLLFRNGIIQESDTLDAKSLPRIQMPNRNGFVPAVPVWPAPPKPSWW